MDLSEFLYAYDLQPDELNAYYGNSFDNGVVNANRTVSSPGWLDKLIDAAAGVGTSYLTLEQKKQAALAKPATIPAGLIVGGVLLLVAVIALPLLLARR